MSSQGFAFPTLEMKTFFSSLSPFCLFTFSLRMRFSILVKKFHSLFPPWTLLRTFSFNPLSLSLLPLFNCLCPPCNAPLCLSFCLHGHLIFYAGWTFAFTFSKTQRSKTEAAAATAVRQRQMECRNWLPPPKKKIVFSQIGALLADSAHRDTWPMWWGKLGRLLTLKT